MGIKMDISNQFKKHPRLVLAVVIVAAGLLLDVSLKQRTPAPDTLVSTGELNGTSNKPADGKSTQTRSNASGASTTELTTDSTETPASTLFGNISVFSENTFLDLPEPQYTPNGLVLKTFEQAHDLCAEKKQRLPTTLEVAKWAARNGAFLASVQDAKRLNKDSDTNAVYLERSAHNKTVDFYFNGDQFVYPKNRPITNASIWTSDERVLGGLYNAKYYAFSLYETRFSAVPMTSSLAVVCLQN